MNDLPLYLTAPEAAKALRVKVQRVHRWIDRGELIAANLSDGRRATYRIARADFLAFLDRRSARPETRKQRRRRRAAPADGVPDRY